ncbi:hypothetical protein MARPO_0121s0044, partial [Marchantia polymorpha]
KVDIGLNSSRKRKEQSHIKYWTTPFLCHKYRSHHFTQHGESYVHYRSLSCKHKKQFFKTKVKITNTLHWYMDLDSNTLMLTINPNIVETIIR